MSAAPGSVVATREAVRRGERTAASVVDDALSAITAVEPAVSAFLSVAADDARRQAAAVDAARAAGRPLGPLAGVPVAVKDNICTRGIPTTAGSRILRGFVPPYDATVVERLTAAGAIVIGKTNCDEFAMGSSTENSAFGPTANPWSTAHAPGGSSGGSAVAVATRAVPASLGSDTGGSIRQPAAFCGIVGLKPSYGRVSRYGLLAFASSLDQIGPFTTTVEDAGELLAVLAGADPRDATSADVPAVAPVPEASGVAGLRIGVPRAFIEGVEASVAAAFESALATWRDLGAIVVDVTLPHVSLAIPVYYLIATAEASSNLARYDGARYGYRAALDAADSVRTMYERTRDEGFGAEVKRRIMLGTYVLSAGYYDAYYLKAQRVRAKLRDAYREVLSTVDVIATPTTPTPAFRLGEKVADPLQMYLADIFTVSANLVGVPAVSVPCGVSPDGLPLGCQLTARMWDEATLIRFGTAFQGSTDWHRRVPTVAAPRA
ncbi:MAG: Asp-tRNA(Asn)/Glu-tRNA(Gln) amidotransferase subunit GatA [Vicinamibacterales bacterium]